jgi:hypothetical protein
MLTMPNPTPDQPHRAPLERATDPWLLWRIASPEERPMLSVAELAECACPDLCDRDHANE